MPSPFEQLGLETTATVEEVKKAWRQLASVHHPDHGGDGAKFNELRQAYQAALKLTSVHSVAAEKCPLCFGSGRMFNPNSRGFTNIKIMCRACMGSGKLRGSQ